MSTAFAETNSASPPMHSTQKDPNTGKTIPLTDGKPCRTCVDVKTWRALTRAQAPSSSKPSSSGKASSDGKATSDGKASSDGKNSSRNNTPTAAAAAGAAGSAMLSQPTLESRAENCPPDSEALGRATWTLLHTMAAYYPKLPSPSQKNSMRSFLDGFAQLYPCWYCAEDFRRDILAHPPEVQSRERLCKWLCERHNEVNRKLGKEEFDCTKVDERWRDGPADGSCD